MMMWALQSARRSYKINDNTVLTDCLLLIAGFSVNTEGSWKAKLLNSMLSPQQNTFWYQEPKDGSCPWTWVSRMNLESQGESLKGRFEQALEEVSHLWVQKTLGSGFASWVLVKMRRTSARIHGRKKTLEPFSLCHFQHITLCPLWVQVPNYSDPNCDVFGPPEKDQRNLFPCSHSVRQLTILQCLPSVLQCWRSVLQCRWSVLQCRLSDTS